jgi:hypothetical protein
MGNSARMAAWVVLLSGARVCAEDGLAGLQARVADDLKRGRPLVVQVHVALCDNSQVRCGTANLGNGDDVKRNLYWATSGGLRGWFERRGSGWTRVSVARGTRPEILEQVTYTRRISPAGVWRELGVQRPFEVVVIASGWRGGAIDGALESFVADLHRDSDAHLVAFVGHNRFMDREPYRFPQTHDLRPKGLVAIACATRPYLAPALSPSRVPLLLTTDLMFAGSHALDGAVQAFAAGAGYAEIRASAARFYAEGQRKPFTRVLGAFTNPSDSRWLRTSRR